MTHDEVQNNDKEDYNPLDYIMGDIDQEDVQEGFGPAGIFSTGDVSADNRQIMAERYVDDSSEDEEDQPHFEKGEFEYEVFSCCLSWQHAERRMFVNEKAIKNIHDRECGCGSQIRIV
jgi:hypothetical protein